MPGRELTEDAKAQLVVMKRDLLANQEARGDLVRIREELRVKTHSKHPSEILTQTIDKIDAVISALESRIMRIETIGR